MALIFTYPREKFEKKELTSGDIVKLINKHRSDVVVNMRKCMDYYEGKHAILEKDRIEVDGVDTPSAKPVSNHAKDISDTASGYFMGSPIVYNSKIEDEDITTNIRKLTDAFDHATTADTDQENALYLSILGRAFEYVYAEEGKSNLLTVSIDPFNVFMVCDDSIEHRELFSIYYYYRKDDTDENKKADLYVQMSTPETHFFYKIKEGEEEVQPYKKEDHYLGYIPIIEYKNNKFCIGDFEQQIGLIDAYNALMADRVNDKEQFVDSILVLYGSLLGDNEKKSDEAHKKLKKKKLLELDEDARAEYLTSTLDESGAEILRKALKEDIYTFSHVPNLTDENFAGNSSGVAMEYKLLGLEMLTKIKERWYRKSLRKRIRIFIHFLGFKNILIDEVHIEAAFARGLPKNLLELSQIVANLQGKVSAKTLISLLPFVEDPDAETKAVASENEEAIKRQQELFASTANNPPEEKLEGNE